MGAMESEHSSLRNLLNQRTYSIYDRAETYCKNMLNTVQELANDYLQEIDIDPEEVCLVATGSVGRLEALEASDLDIIPVLKSNETSARFATHDKDIRALLHDNLEIKVSKGDDLTRFAEIGEFTDPDTIGGDKDDSTRLTKRILVLTEGRQAGGNYSLQEIRRQILCAYAGAERTRGRHVLSFCNDVARYYRTLCIEYKAKVDIHDKDWCTRNIKLRHSRKFWYFSLIVSIVALAIDHPSGEGRYVESLLNCFEQPPYLRMFGALGQSHGILLADLLERYASFLEFMASTLHREALAKIEHGNRYASTLENPFPQMKLNSDLLGIDMIRIMDNLPGYMREMIFEWFLL